MTASGGPLALCRSHFLAVGTFIEQEIRVIENLQIEIFRMDYFLKLLLQMSKKQIIEQVKSLDFHVRLAI